MLAFFCLFCDFGFKREPVLPPCGLHWLPPTRHLCGSLLPTAQARPRGTRVTQGPAARPRVARGGLCEVFAPAPTNSNLGAP